MGEKQKFRVGAEERRQKWGNFSQSSEKRSFFLFLESNKGGKIPQGWAWQQRTTRGRSMEKGERGSKGRCSADHPHHPQAQKRGERKPTTHTQTHKKKKKHIFFPSRNHRESFFDEAAFHIHSEGQKGAKNNTRLFSTHSLHPNCISFVHRKKGSA